MSLTAAVRSYGSVAFAVEVGAPPLPTEEKGNVDRYAYARGLGLGHVVGID